MNFKLLVATIVLSMSCAAKAASQKPVDRSTALKKIVKSYRIPTDRLGLAVMELSQVPHKMIYSLNGDHQMIPASLTKLLTAAAVLHKFGPSRHFETSLMSEAKQKDDTLTGDLYLVGGGDPGFVSESMWDLVNDFYRTGIRKIKGDIVVDESRFDSVRFDPSRDPERVDRAYDAPIGAMSFNWNAINVFVRPTKAGKKPAVWLDPDIEGWTIENRAKTSLRASSLRVSRENPDTIWLSGRIPGSTAEAVFYKSVEDPARWSGQALKAFLKQRGITVTGHLKVGKAPKAAHLLAKTAGKPTSMLLLDMLKFSNNFIAEMLTKNLAAEFVSQPAKMEDGVKIIRDTLLELGWKKENFSLVNPSGLTRRNRVRADDLVSLLNEVHKRFSYSPEYLSALPLAGIDGTLKHRFQDSAAQGHVRAKTGTLDGVVGLAGYTGQKDGRTYAFAFIFNGPANQGDLARRLFDALASELMK